MVEYDVPSGEDQVDSAYVENPVTTERFRFHTTPDDPRREPLEFDIWASPSMPPLADHVHELQDERFQVEAGTIELRRDGTTHRLSEGEAVTVPAGTPHTWEPVGDSDIHITVRFEPGLEMAAFLRDLATLAQRGAVAEDGAPSPLQIAAMYDAYGYELLHLASPPLPVQKLLFGILAPIARWRGYRANPVAVSGP